MKLTELKEKIDEALRLHDDYDVKIIIEGDDSTLKDCEIDSGRFNFNIEVDVPRMYDECEDYHIHEDDCVAFCEKCDIYHSTSEKCPGCELKELKRNLKNL